MSGENRTAIIAKLVKVAKKHYPVVSPPANRSVLDNLLYACLLENSSFQAADEAFARLEQYSDWNEVRVTTTQELCELAAGLSDPQVAVERLKLALHSIFEVHYAFELDFLLKENQGKVVTQLEKYKGVTPFVVAYLVQNSFGGHKIPTCEASLNFADALGLVTPKEKETGTVPGFERAVPKTKGPEFFSTMHQFAVEFSQSPQDKQILSRVKEVSPDACKRLDAAGLAAKGSTTTAEGGKSSATKSAGGKSSSGQASGQKGENSQSGSGKPSDGTAATGSDGSKKLATSKPVPPASGAEKTAGVASQRAAGGKPNGAKSGDQAGNPKAGAANAKGKADSAAVDSKGPASKPAAPKAATTKPVAAKSSAPKPSAKPAAKSPEPPAGKKPTHVKSAASEKPPAAKAVSGKKKPR